MLHRNGRRLLSIAAALAAAIPALAAPTGPAAFDVPVQSLPTDQDTEVSGVPVACTGIGGTRDDPRWAAYPVRVEFSNARAEYLTDAEIVLVNAGGKALFKVRCAAPWVLLKPPAGSYSVHGQLLNSGAMPRSAPFKVPAKGQVRVVLQFPDA
jgi:hypothetical protein